MHDVQEILSELRRMPLKGIVSMDAAKVRTILAYISDLERRIAD